MVDLEAELASKLCALKLDNLPENPHNVDKEQFDVHRFLGRGCYSLVYEVQKNIGVDTGTLYALKKFFLLSSSAMKCVLRERQILERLAENEIQSHFLPTLFYSLWIPYSPIFVLNEGCGRDLFDLIKHAGQMDECTARFYLVEIMSGLEIVHNMGIVHLDLKPENILLRASGHVFIADFDRSYDSTLATTAPTDDDFTGTPLFMAPEIASGKILSSKADVWSLGILMAEMVSGPVRPAAKDTVDDFRMAREGRVRIRRLKYLTKAMQSFFSATLKVAINERPDLGELKKLKFLKFTNWDNVAQMKLTPPFDPMEILHRPCKEDRQILAENDERILNDAFAAKPSVCYGGRKLNADQVDDQAELPDLQRDTPTSFDGIDIKWAFNNFTYVHPKFRSKNVAQTQQIKDPKLTNQRIRCRTLSAGD